MNRIKIKSLSHTTNPTKLKTIHKKYFSVNLKESVENLTFFNIKKLELDSLDLPPDASVYIYVTAGQSEVKFALGTVGNRADPKDRFLDSLPKSTIWFRLLVVDDKTSKILASAEKIRPKAVHEKGREPLLPVYVSEKLKNRIWKVHLVPDQQPILHLNKFFPEIFHQIQHGKVFQALILQEAMRISLEHFIRSDRGDNNPDTWLYKWDLFLKDLQMYKTTPVFDADSLIIDRWIDRVIEAFSKRANLFDNAVEENNRLYERVGNT